MSNIQQYISSLKLDELQNILKEIKVYKALSRGLWRRWRNLYHKQHNNTKQYVVEYYPSLWEDSAWEQAQSVYKKVLDEAVEKSDIIFIQKPELKWGMKVYADDTMVDLSYSKIEKQIQ